MATVIESNEKLKEAFKMAIVELLQERQDLVRDILDEIVEDIAFSKAIAEGEQTPRVSRESVFEVLESVN
ncbi:MAG: hypothetical protein JSS77_10465 [Acidobacteria bacterium]|nr:hypothetical protein [Acidobacteriota bacterium]HMM80521.1 hypothetical protein [Pyrinomonadaceae bacterium]